VVHSEAVEAVRTPEQTGGDAWRCRMRVCATLGAANALERGHGDASDTTHFVIQFSKLRNSKKCQHT
jgi:hypothetical protein